MQQPAAASWALDLGWQIFILLACLAAAADTQRPELQAEDDEQHELARRMGRRWRRAALLLIGAMAALYGGLGGLAGVAAFAVNPPGAIWLLQAGLLAVLVRAGAGWAGALGREPFKHESLIGAAGEAEAEGTAGGAASAIGDGDQLKYNDKYRRLRQATTLFRRWPWGELSALLIAMHGWTLLLTRLAPHAAEAGLAGRMGLERVSPWLAWPLAVAMLTLAPILEEILFRHYLLYRLAWPARRGPAPAATAIALSAAAFAVGHYGAIDPWWLKLVQTFGLGLALGVVAWRHGLAPAIALHWAFNITLIPMTFFIH